MEIRDESMLITETLGSWLDKMADEYGERDALVCVDSGVTLSYRQFNERCCETARAFMSLGVKKGDKVAIWASNRPEWLYTLFGAAKIGAVLVTVNTNYKVYELEYLLRQSDSHTIIFTAGVKDVKYASILRELVPEIEENGSSIGFNCKRLPFLKNAVFIPRWDGSDSAEGFMTWDEMMQRGADVPVSALREAQADTNCEDVINMQYTSGTTGFPKGVMLTHKNILNNGFFIGEKMHFTKEDRLCITVPFFHCFGLVLATMASITHAAAMVPVDVFSPLTVLSTIEKARCTAVHGVPTMFIFMLGRPEFDSFDLTSLRTGIMAGSPCPIDVMREVVRRMHMRDICITYGQTEASPATTMSDVNDSLELRVSTVGRAMPFCETKLVDPETGEEVPVGVTGEFCCRGYNVMKGYYKMEEATKNAIDEEGWLHSGDLAVVDENGYYRITGRIKDMIIRGGENIYPREIEELYHTHPDVSDVQVVGMPSKKFGEEVVAFIIKKPGATLDEEGARTFAAERMARHKVPARVEFVEEFPMTASGKIQKFKLRAMAAELADK